jgi:GTPase SAR1 family protein
MSGDFKFLMLGLRGSGKTTFLAALWHFIESGEIEDRLSMPLLQPDRDYLNAARNSWLAVKPVGRTTMRSTNNVSLTLLDKTRNARIDMSLPDLSGESFRLQWVTRKAPKSYVELARGCAGAFLFLHPNDVARTHVIKPLTVEQPPTEEEQSVSTIPSSTNWTPAQSSTQVQLVDILQLLMRLRQTETKMRVAIVISAWDVVKAKIPPAVWLERRLPLLSQYVRANPDKMASDVFGVSAQGGDLTADRVSLLHASVPSSRCYVVRGSSLDRMPITAPLQFLLDDRDVI